MPIGRQKLDLTVDDRANRCRYEIGLCKTRREHSVAAFTKVRLRGGIQILVPRRACPAEATARLPETSWKVSDSRPLIDYATAAPFAIGFLETALAIEDSSNGIWR